MSDFLTAVPTGLTAFAATNLDDILILLLWFSQANALFDRRQIIAGQYLGFITLVLISLPGFFSSLFLPEAWIGMLGIVPIAIGLNRLLSQTEDDTENNAENNAEIDPTKSPLGSLLSPQTYGVAAVTFANGSDNVGVYMPLFASCSWESLAAILSVFFALVGVWCYAAYRLALVPAIAEALTRYGNQFVPYVLIGLGGMILWESHTLEDRGLLALALVVGCCYLVTLSRGLMQPIEVEK